METRKLAGVIVVLLGLNYGLAETRFFGNHWSPSCPEEVIANGLALIVLCIGVLILALK